MENDELIQHLLKNLPSLSKGGKMRKNLIKQFHINTKREKINNKGGAIKSASATSKQAKSLFLEPRVYSEVTQDSWYFVGKDQSVCANFVRNWNETSEKECKIFNR